jgi:serine/threonine protein kinase
MPSVRRTSRVIKDCCTRETVEAQESLPRSHKCTFLSSWSCQCLSVCALMTLPYVEKEHAILVVPQAILALSPSAIMLQEVMPQTGASPYRGILTDFGSALPIAESTVKVKQANTIGKPAYISPEQWRGKVYDTQCRYICTGCRCI